VSAPMRRRLLGIASFWPALYLLFFVAVVGMAALSGGGDPDRELPVAIEVLVVLHLTTMLVIVALLVLFVRDAYRNPRVEPDKRVFWAIVLVLLNAIALPAYWWLYVRSQPNGPRA
jgi:heme A synthase